MESFKSMAPGSALSLERNIGYIVIDRRYHRLASSNEGRAPTMALVARRERDLSKH